MNRKRAKEGKESSRGRKGEVWELRRTKSWGPSPAPERKERKTNSRAFRTFSERRRERSHQLVTS
jgi:hypothetical protein